MLESRIREMRKGLGLSQEQLAAKIGVSRQAVTKWETGAGTPDVDNLVELARLFGVTVDELLGNSVEAQADGGATDEEARFPEAARFTNETICQINEPRRFDINFPDARLVRLTGTDGFSVRVLLASDEIEGLGDAAATVFDNQGRGFDIDIRAIEGISRLDARGKLDILIELPNAFAHTVELTGNAERVEVDGLTTENLEFGARMKDIDLRGVTGHVGIDSADEARIRVDMLPWRLDVNQMKATSRLEVPADAAFVTRTRGFGNRIMLEGVAETEGAESLIELNGMRSELTIAASK